MRSKVQGLHAEVKRIPLRDADQRAAKHLHSGLPSFAAHVIVSILGHGRVSDNGNSRLFCRLLRVVVD